MGKEQDIETGGFMQRSNVEQRSKRYVARQFVSDFEIEGPVMSDGNSVTERSVGIVKFYNDDKGFGFCRRENGAADVFIHANELRRSGVSVPVKPGDRLEFDAVAVPGKGPKAQNIKTLA